MSQARYSLALQLSEREAEGVPDGWVLAVLTLMDAAKPTIRMWNHTSLARHNEEGIEILTEKKPLPGLESLGDEVLFDGETIFTDEWMELEWRSLDLVPELRDLLLYLPMTMTEPCSLSVIKEVPSSDPRSPVCSSKSILSSLSSC